MTFDTQNPRIVRLIQAGLNELADARLVIDGIWGPKSEAALARYLNGDGTATGEPQEQGDRVDERSERNIATLLPEVQPVARKLVRMADQQGITIKVTSGTRSFEEQAELYRKYKAGTGGKAAPPGHSNHQYGIAFDITVFQNEHPVWESPLYKVVGTLGESIGLSWGHSFGDDPHFCLRPEWALGMTESNMITELRRLHPNGIA